MKTQAGKTTEREENKHSEINDQTAGKKPAKPVIDESEEWAREYKKRTGEEPSFF